MRGQGEKAGVVDLAPIETRVRPRRTYDQPVDMDYWDDDGSRDFALAWERTASGPVS